MVSSFHFASRYDLHTSASLFALKCFTTIFQLLLYLFCFTANTKRSFPFSVFLLLPFTFNLRDGYSTFHKYFPEVPRARVQETLSQKLYGIGKYLPWALQLFKNPLVFPVILTQKVCFFVLSLAHCAHIDVYEHVCLCVRASPRETVCVNSLGSTLGVLLRRFINCFHSTTLRDAKSVGNTSKTRSKCVCSSEGPLSRSFN